MDRILSFITLTVALAGAAVANEPDDRHSTSWGADAGYVHVSGLPSWTEGSVGKFRFKDDGIMVSRAYLDYHGRWTDTLNAHIVMEAYDDDLGVATDFTEAYLEWRPVPRTATRYREKVGAFYPRISLENIDAGWGSPYTLNSSAINTWVAEELRSTGVEVTASRRPVSLGGSHLFSLSAAAFVGNDPAGTELAWKGWSVHDRQTRFGDDLPLPPLPQIQPGMLFQTQAPFNEPIREVDDRVGYHVNGEWKYGRKLLVTAMYYDNRADPEALEHGQYGWTTRFQHVGVQTVLPGDIGMIAQWMGGTTVMGPIVDGAYVVDVEYDSTFLLLTRAFGRHRVAGRYDDFNVSEIDRIPLDDNSEDGHAWTLGYQFAISDGVSVAAEWVSIDTYRPSFAYYGFPLEAREEQTQLMLKLRF